jgi:cytochrome c-type biogenesis protein CcmH/NrfF
MNASTILLVFIPFMFVVVLIVYLVFHVRSQKRILESMNKATETNNRLANAVKHLAEVIEKHKGK